MKRLHRNLDYWVFSCLLGLAGFARASSASADSMRCNDRIVSNGDSRYDVRSKCGEPDDATQRIEYRTASGRCWEEGDRIRCERTSERIVEVVIDEWVYDFGRNRFVEYVTFVQGRLVSVRTGKYGYKPAR